MTEVIGSVEEAIRKNQSELAAIRKANKDLKKAQRKRAKLEKKNKVQKAKKLLRENGLEFGVVVLCNGKPVFVPTRPEIESFRDPITGDVHLFEVRRDGRLTTDEVTRRFNNRGNGRNVQIDSERTASRVYESNCAPRQMIAYMRDPGHYDIEGYDSPPHSATIPAVRRNRR